VNEQPTDPIGHEPLERTEPLSVESIRRTLRHAELEAARERNREHINAWLKDWRERKRAYGLLR
jgi:hypothetical protein